MGELKLLNYEEQTNDDFKIFKHSSLGKLRVSALETDFWCIAKDITDMLGYRNGEKIIQTSIADYDKLSMLLPKIGKVSLLNEGGVYSLINKNKTSSAKLLDEWLTKDILPQFKRVEITSKSEVTETVSCKHDFQDDKDKEIAELKELVSYMEMFVPKETDMTVGEYAQLLFNKGLNFGERRLYTWLKDQRLIKYKSSFERRYYVPTQIALNSGWIVYKSYKYGKIGHKFDSCRVYITEKGQKYIYKKLVLDECNKEIVNANEGKC